MVSFFSSDFVVGGGTDGTEGTEVSVAAAAAAAAATRELAGVVVVAVSE